MKMICDDCGCTENEYDEDMGERVCKDCGLVLVTEMFEETVHILDNVGNVKHSSDKGKLGSVITGKGSYQFNKFGKNSVMPQHIQNGLMHCNMVLAQVCPQMDLKERVEELYIKLLNKGLFGRTGYEERATALVYYVLKENGTPYPFKDVCSEFNPSLRVVKRLVRKINQEFRNRVNYTPVNPQFVLKRTLSNITDDFEFQRQCIKVLEFFERKITETTFNKGRSYYAAIIWIAANLNVRKDITCVRISEMTGFSKWIIRRQTKAILNMIGYDKATEIKGKDINRLGE